MPFKPTDFHRPDPDAEYEDILVYDDDGTIIKKPPINQPKTVNCCQCNTATSWCVPEQLPGNVATTAVAQTLAYLFS